MITIIFTDETDYYFARQRVQEKLAIASTFLPAGVTPYMAPDATALGQIFWYTVEGDGKDLGELRSIQDWYVRYQLASVPGVAEVASVGGAPREYQIDVDPNKLRAYGIGLGEVYSAVSRSNSAVGGRVIHQGNAEYLIRSVGWIASLRDIENTVITQRNGTPVLVKNLATVQVGQTFRRSVLEKDGNEAVGGVVLMRVGENPLEVTRRIKEKIASLQEGLQGQGARIVPFYDRTPLIRQALETVGGTVKEELIVCTIAILLVMGHVGSAFVVAITLPMAILFSFLMMRLFGLSSNIMSLAGISISVGILIDQAVVMGENAAHHLTRHFGERRITGDITELVIPACKAVGRPIFFSVVITILSFLPVFALTGREGKLFHPLAYTKTFALVGVALLSITLVPALIPIFLKGRIKSEEESWLVRSMIEIFKPMLSWLMDRTTLVCWLFAVIVGLGYVASTKLGREFMPDLDEQTLMDMPTTVPRASIAQVGDDLRTRDAILRGFPEVRQVVGKAGRAETPTDPAPLDMVETMINLRDRSAWPRRGMRFTDATLQVKATLDAMESKELIRLKPEDRDALVNEVAMMVSSRVDEILRDLAVSRLAEFRPETGRALTGEAIDTLLGRLGSSSLARSLTQSERSSLVDDLSKTYADRLASEILSDDASALVREATRKLVSLGVLRERPDLLTLSPGSLDRASEIAGEVLGFSRPTLAGRIADHLAEEHARRLGERVKSLDWELFDRAVGVATWSALEEVTKLAKERKFVLREPATDELQTLRSTLEKPFAERLLLWRKSKNELIEEMNTALQLPGWGNSFTQPIANRIEMLSTGVRLPVAVKLFGSNLDDLQRVSKEIAAVLRTVRGAADVFPDQVTGKGYVEIRIDREKAARYGINVGDLQDSVEVAMGGRPLTMTVEGRERYPVRVRYARAFRDDVESLRRVLVSASGPAANPVQVPLAELADVRVVEGPSMIKGENGLLRSYIQLNVRGRDEVGFVEEARRVVQEKVKLPAGMYLEWSGTFEHQVRAQKTLRVVFPAVIAVIAFILYLTHKSWVDALLMMTSVLGALAGGAIFQWLFGFRFSVAVQVGYIACFGMAVETGVVMLVYLREAIEERGGLARIASIDELRTAILEGAVHRLRPKLLTEGAAIVSIAPMLWASGSARR